MPQKLLNFKWKLAGFKMAVSLEPFDRFWCFNFWVKALDVYFHPGTPTTGATPPPPPLTDNTAEGHFFNLSILWVVWTEELSTIKWVEYPRQDYLLENNWPNKLDWISEELVSIVKQGIFACRKCSQIYWNFQKFTNSSCAWIFPVKRYHFKVFTFLKCTSTSLMHTVHMF